MAKKYYAVYYGDGKGKIFTRLKAFQSATAKKSAKLYRGFGVKLEAELWLKDPAAFPKEKKFFAVKVGIHPGIYDKLQPLELSERAELESPPPLRGALGTILI